MVSRVADVQRRAALIFAQIDAAKKLYESMGEDTSVLMTDDSMYMSMLFDLYNNEYQLARLLDTSDLIVHAEGPAAVDSAPNAGVVKWLIESVNDNMRKLVQGAMHLTAPQMKDFSLQMTGLAPGSIYAGFAIKGGDRSDLFLRNQSIKSEAKSVIQSFLTVPQFVVNSRLNPEISEAIIDPVIRDSAIMAAYKVSPTGRMGINSLEFTSPDSPSSPAAEFSTASRSVLKTAATLPQLSKRRQHYGSFIGDLRGIDLDQTRLDLRNIDSDEISTLRCFLATLDPQKAKQWIGKRVKVTGNYEALDDGMPRLMRIDTVEVLEKHVQADLFD